MQEFDLCIRAVPEIILTEGGVDGSIFTPLPPIQDMLNLPIARSP
jgi:hypothetical protein